MTKVHVLKLTCMLAG